VATALEAVIGTGNCSVSGSAGGPYTVTFTGALAGQDVSSLSGAGTGPNEQQTIEITGGSAGDQLVLTLGSASTSPLAYNASAAQVAAALEALAGVGNGNVSVTAATGGWVVEFIGALAKTAVSAISGVCGKNEQQSVALDASVTGGTFTLALGSAVSAAIAYNAAPANVQTALEAVTGIGAGNVSVAAGTPSGWVITFQGTLANSAVALLIGDGTNLVGTITAVTVTEVVVGDSELVAVTETQAPHADPTVTVASVANASDGSQYSWLSA
jgi:hypothetical protein